MDQRKISGIWSFERYFNEQQAIRFLAKLITALLFTTQLRNTTLPKPSSAADDLAQAIDRRNRPIAPAKLAKAHGPSDWN